MDLWLNLKHKRTDTVDESASCSKPGEKEAHCPQAVLHSPNTRSWGGFRVRAPEFMYTLAASWEAILHLGKVEGEYFCVWVGGYGQINVSCDGSQYPIFSPPFPLVVAP